MISLNAVLKFMQLSGISTDRLERLAKLEPGAIENAKRNSGDLSNNIIANIVCFLGPALINYDFDIVPCRVTPGVYKLVPPDVDICTGL